MYDQAKKKLVDFLAEVDSSLALTTDIWTSMSNDAYITVTAHWISSEWEIKCFVLATKEFPGSHTGTAT